MGFCSEIVVYTSLRHIYKYVNLHIHVNCACAQTPRFGVMAEQSAYLGAQTPKWTTDQKLWVKEDRVMLFFFQYFSKHLFFKEEFQALFCCRSLNSSQCVQRINDRKHMEDEEYTKTHFIFA